MIEVTDENFIFLAQQYWQMRKHRKRIRQMAEKYPVVVEFKDRQFVWENADEFDLFVKAFRKSLVDHWRRRVTT